MLYGFERMLDKGVPIGPFAEPATFFVVSPTAKLHQHTGCKRLGSHTVVERAVVARTTPESAFCRSCTDATKHHPLALYLRAAGELLAHRRHTETVTASLEEGQLPPLDRVAALRRAVEWSAYQHPVHSDLKELINELYASSSQALVKALAAVQAESLPTLLRHCAASLMRDGSWGSYPRARGVDTSSLKRPVAYPGQSNDVLLGAWQVWSGQLRDGASYEEAAAQCLALVTSKLGPEPGAFELVPRTARLSPDGFANPAEWAAAEWRLVRDEAVVATTDHWEAKVDKAIAAVATEADAILALSLHRITAGPVANALAAFEMERNCRITMVRLPHLVAEWVEDNVESKACWPLGPATSADTAAVLATAVGLLEAADYGDELNDPAAALTAARLIG